MSEQQPASKQRYVFNDRAVPSRITEYLGNGGLWNPDLMNHEAVRDLLIDARDVVEMLLRERAANETPPTSNQCDRPTEQELCDEILRLLIENKRLRSELGRATDETKP